MMKDNNNIRPKENTHDVLLWKKSGKKCYLWIHHFPVDGNDRDDQPAAKTLTVVGNLKTVFSGSVCVVF